jgi:hypothetical protein
MYRIVFLPIASIGLFSAVLLAANASWQDKEASDWNEDEVKQVMSDSPWAKMVTPQYSQDDSSRRAGNGGGGRGMGGGGIGIGGIGISLPGMGRRYPQGGGYPQGGSDNGRGDRNYDNPTELTLRWESALPIREAELKAKETNAPSVDENHYAIAIFGVPSRMASGDRRSLEDTLRKQAVLKRDGKKDIKPSGVEVLNREDGPVIVYLFPKSSEISKSDRRVEFDGQIGKLKFAEPFYLEDMVYRGKLEL